MNWYWKARIHRPDGHYAIVQIRTPRIRTVIDDIEDFYEALTGAKLILEGMSNEPYENLTELNKAFNILWSPR